MTLQGRTALVTGAGRGIGEGIAQVLAEHGARVAVNDLHEDRARTVADAIVAAGGEAAPLPFDVREHESVRAGIRETEERFGPVDILVNNAGIPEGRFVGPFAESSPEAWKPYIDLNAYGPMYCIREVLPGMCERGWGRLIQISSGAAARGLPGGSGDSVYGASKAIIDGLLRHVALEVARDGVTFNAVAPGLISSALVYADPAVVADILTRVPMGRLGEPREIGDAVAWLASDAAAFVTGQVIHVNGGSYQGR